MSAYIGSGTKRNTAELKTIYENSDQILALEVSLFVQIKPNSKWCLPQQYLPSDQLRYYCFATDRHVIRPPLKPEMNLTVHFR